MSILVGAMAAVPIGRWLDRATIAVLAWSQVHTVTQLYLVFVLIGLSSAAVLYETSFTVIVKNTAPSHRHRAILIVTVFGGLAGTIFLPLGWLLTEQLGWRGALMVLAGQLAATAALHFAVVPATVSPPATGPSIPIERALKDPAFWLMALAFTANGAGVFAFGIHAYSYLSSLGHPAPVAATIAGLTGISSVTGRVLGSWLAVRHGTARVAAAMFAAQGVAALLLPLLGRSAAGAALCVLGFGLGFGIANIARPALFADRYGAGDFGGISGVAAVPITIAKAAAPVAVAALSLALLPLFAAVVSLLAAALTYSVWTSSTTRVSTAGSVSGSTP